MDTNNTCTWVGRPIQSDMRSSQGDIRYSSSPIQSDVRSCQGDVRYSYAHKFVMCGDVRWCAVFRHSALLAIMRFGAWVWLGISRYAFHRVRVRFSSDATSVFECNVCVNVLPKQVMLKRVVRKCVPKRKETHSSWSARTAQPDNESKHSLSTYFFKNG